MQAFKQQTNEAHIALNTLYSLFLLQTHFPDVHVHFHSKEEKKKKNSSEVKVLKNEIV